MQPHQAWDVYIATQEENKTQELKSTPCKDCRYCFDDVVFFNEAIGSLCVGFCLEKYEFLTKQDMEKNTMFDCFGDDL